VIFTAFTVLLMLWIYRKGSGRLYQELAGLPLGASAGPHDNPQHARNARPEANKEER
jgi:hypothetical protein